MIHHNHSSNLIKTLQKHLLLQISLCVHSQNNEAFPLF
jgi:hypothetical protein